MSTCNCMLSLAVMAGLVMCTHGNVDVMHLARKHVILASARSRSAKHKLIGNISSCMRISAEPLCPTANESSEDSRSSASAGPCYSKRVSYHQSCATSQLANSNPGLVQVAHSKAAAHRCRATAQAHLQAGSLQAWNKGLNHLLELAGLSWRLSC